MTVHNPSTDQTLPIDLAQLAGELAAATPALEESERRVAVELYRLLAKGDPVPAARVAERAGLPLDRVTRALRDWPGVFSDDGGKVIGFWGLSLREMPHRFLVGDALLYTWCGWDALFIPEILGRTARLETRCPVTRQTISLTVAPGGVREVSPPGAVLSFIRPAKPFDADMILSFCHYVLFFATEEAGREWTAEHKDTFLVSIEDGFELGRLTNQAKFGAPLNGERLS